MRFTFCILFTLFFSAILSAQVKTISLLPYPLKVKQGQGTYLLKKSVTVSGNFPAKEWVGLFQYFKNELKNQYDINTIQAQPGKIADIHFLKKKLPAAGKSAYELNVSKNGVTITGEYDNAVFYAMQTFFQLLPTDLTLKKEIPIVNISDEARFDYRGMHLDVGRHFFPVSFIKRYIDYLAYHKLNKFHWHLTEDQGWRIEIKKYPDLTKIGAWRNGTIIGRYPGKGNDNIPHGGFYTQDEIKEVVKYARERFIDVIPEIEMPGHSSAAIAAYPWLSCFPLEPTPIPANMISEKSIEQQKNGRIKLVQETWGVFDDVFCAGNDSTFMFLENVIDEVIALFPSKYFHVGGDESPKTHWKICPKCQKRIKELGLKDEHELQSYFIQRIEKYLNKKGKILIGWDEILEGGLAPNAIVMSWRGEQGGIDAAKQKHQVIMTPGNPVYFDHSQSENEDSVTIGGYNPIDKVYAYEPIPKELNKEEGRFVLGAQANVWTEYMDNPQKVEYMIFPRMAALCEVLWTAKEHKNWENFKTRLLTQFKRYENWHANYSKAFFELKTAVVPAKDYQGILWKLTSNNPADKILFKIQSPEGVIKNYTGPIKINETGKYEAWIASDQQSNPMTKQDFIFNKATGKNISLLTPASENYPGDGAFTLVDGIQNTKGLARGKEFLGFNGTNCDAVIDLGKTVSIQQLIVHVLEQKGSWIYFPKGVDLFTSDDGTSFTELKSQGTIEDNLPVKNSIKIELDKPVSTRYLKIVVLNHGLIAEGNPGAGNKAWLFVDEFELN